MEEYFEILSQNPLFAGISQEERISMMDCLEPKVVEVGKGEPVFLEGDAAGFLGLVLRVVKNVIEEAVALKAENDFTI